MKEIYEISQDYKVGVREDGKTVIFEIPGKKSPKAIAKLSLQNTREKQKQHFYRLENINSFDEKKGQGAALLGAINKFAKETNSVITASVRLKRKNFFKNNGWEELGRPGKTSIAMSYNYNL